MVKLGWGLASLLALVACAVGPSEERTESQTAEQNSLLCGNGVRDPGEQCDDGNTTNLDGCSRTCDFEQVHRMNRIEMMFNTDAYCSANALGGAIGSFAQGQIQDAVTGGVTSGAISILLPFLGLEDLNGVNAPSFTLGSVPGTTTSTAGVYVADPSALDADRFPLAQLPATIDNSQLAVGPGNLAFAMTLGGGAPANIRLSNAKLKAQIGAASTPTGHAASEHLDPALTSFATTTGGQLCGNISAASLAAIPAPPELQSGGSANCSQGYTAANSLLDVLVGGCRVFIVTALRATQPDKADPTAAIVGGGAPYSLTVGAGKKVTGCKDRNGGAVSLGACLASAAYSSAFRFTTNRVIAK